MSELLETIDKVDERATDIGEMLLGTTIGRVIDSQREMLRNLVREGELGLASVQVLQLAATCNYAEKVSNESKI